MRSLSSIKKFILVIGDIATLYAALVITLWIRYGSLFYAKFVDLHLEPFTIVFAVWILIFYIAGLYDLKYLKNNFDFEKTYWYTLIFNIVLAALFFYGNPYFAIEQKTNLFLFLLIFGVINYLWRQLYNLLLGKTAATHRLLLIGSNRTAKEIAEHIEHNPQLGYRVNFWMQDGLQDKEFQHLSQIIIAQNITTNVIPAHLKKDAPAARLIYKCLTLGIEVIELSRFYEILFRKVPLAELEEVWFLEHLIYRHNIYETVSNPLERIAAVLLGIILLPLMAMIAVLIAATSPGPVIFRQKRIGKGETEFLIYKFRTMRSDAEKDGPQWANYHKDGRATWIGKILRRSHLDELPQLINIIKGELSFVGPRPERPEFVEKLRKELPYYDLRHLTKPGITGWAQINYRYAASAEDAYQKLQYDIYYLENNSLILDFIIVIKTIKFLITNHV